MRYKTLLLIMTLWLAPGMQAIADDDTSMSAEASWLPSLITDSPEAGFDLAVKMSRTSVKTIQSDVEVLKKLRPAYAHDPDSLIAASGVVARYFRIVAEANDYWRD